MSAATPTVQDGIAWVVIAATLLAYLRQRGLISERGYVVPAVNVDEPDVTRWRHDGSQSYDWRTGNRAPVLDEAAAELGMSL